MACDNFEFMLKEKIGKQDIIEFLASHFEISRTHVIEKDNFFDKEKIKSEIFIGLTVHTLDDGFQTLVQCLVNARLKDIQLLQLAAYAAIFFKTEIVIGDFRAEAAGQQDACLLFYADGSVAECVDNSYGGINNVEFTRFLPASRYD